MPRVASCVLVSVALIFSTSPRSEASSYCPGCAAAFTGAIAAVGVGVGLTIFYVHRSHTSLTGCVLPTRGGLTLTAKNNKRYELVSPPGQLKPNRRVLLRGHKTKTPSGLAFRVDVSRTTTAIAN